EVHRYEGHRGPVYRAVLSRDGRLLLTGGADQTGRLWRFHSEREVRRLSGHTGRLIAGQLAADRRGALSGGGGGRGGGRGGGGRGVAGRGGRGWGGHDRGRAVGFREAGRRAWPAGEDATLREWRLPEPPPAEPAGLLDRAHAVALAADGKALAQTIG